MMPWMPFLMMALFLLVADAAGWIDLSTRPLRRIIKWLAAALWLWFLPQIISKIFKFAINPELLNLWKLFILAVLLGGLIFALIKWIYRHYGPPPEGCRRCPHCRASVLKLMLECPECRKKI